MSNPTAVGPVCNVPTEPEFPTPTVPLLPFIPVATDLQTGLKAINAMRQIILMLTNQIPDNNTSGNSGGGGGGGARPPDNQKKNTQGNFVELRPLRRSSTVRVFNPNDHTQFVDVEQIDGLHFANKAGQKVTWSR